MQTALIGGLSFGCDPPTDVRQIFQDNRAAWLGSHDDLLTQDMIAVAAKPGLSAPHLPQVALGALRPRCLQDPTQFEGETFEGSPAFLTEKLIGARDSWLRQAQIDPHDLVCRLDDRRGDVYHDMQPPGAIMLDEIGCRDLPTNVGGGVLWHVKGQTHPALCRGESDPARVPIDLERVHVVARRACVSHWRRDLAAFAFQGQGTFDRLSGFHSGLDMQVADERRGCRFTSVVGRMMQVHAVCFAMLPTIGADRVEGIGEQSRGFSQGVSLLRCRLQGNSHRSVHVHSIPYTLRFCQAHNKKGGARFPPPAQAEGPQRAISYGLG